MASWALLPLDPRLFVSSFLNPAMYSIHGTAVPKNLAVSGGLYFRRKFFCALVF
jgi:hypothetical protein